MAFDLYADGAVRDLARQSHPQGCARFDILADAHADVMLRISAALNLLNVAPRMMHMEARPEGTAAVEALVDCAEAQAELVARKLQQITSVHNVAVAYVIALDE